MATAVVLYRRTHHLSESERRMDGNSNMQNFTTSGQNFSVPLHDNNQVYA